MAKPELPGPEAALPNVTYQAGMFIPATSRYKCFYQFLRPPALFVDPSGRTVEGPSPGKTLCTLKKGHEEPHENNRGETCSLDARDQVAAFNTQHMKQLIEEMKAMRKLIDEQKVALELLKQAPAATSAQG